MAILRSNINQSVLQYRINSVGFFLYTKILPQLTQYVQLENVYIVIFTLFVKIDFTHLILDHKQGYHDYSHHGIDSSYV